MSVIAGVLGRAGEKGQNRRKADAGRGLCTWNNPPDIETWIQEKRARESAERSAEGDEEDEVPQDDGKEIKDDEEEMFVSGFKNL